MKRKMRTRILALLLVVSLLMNGNISASATTVAPADSKQGSHVHTEECYTYKKVTEEAKCGKEVVEGHAHVDSCYKTEELSCMVEESEGHKHDAACYTALETKELICELDEIEGHAHDDNCYEWEKELTCKININDDDSKDESKNVQPEEAIECTTTEYAVGGEDDEVKVTVTLENAKDLSDEAELVSEEIELTEDEEAALKAIVDEKAIYVNSMTALDIRFELEVAGEEGEEAIIKHPQPANPVTVSVALPEVTVEDTVNVYHVAVEEVETTTEDGETEVKSEIIIEDMEAVVNEETAAVEFKTSHFSTYVFVKEGVDPATVDVETAEIWEATLPELTGVYGDDVAAIAKSQLGYKQSEVNVETDEEGNVTGHYSRYGAWNKTPYAAWNTLFAKFCVSYAKIPADRFPVADTAAAWVEALSSEDYEMFIPASTSKEEYEPCKGDLIFFDADADGVADRVAVIVEIAEDGTITTVEEVAGMVANASYAAGDATILGYGMMPFNMEEEEMEVYDDTYHPVVEPNYYMNPINENIDVTLYNYGSYINVGADRGLQFGWHSTLVDPNGRTGNYIGRPFEGIDGPAMRTNGTVFDSWHKSDPNNVGIYYSNKLYLYPTVERTLKNGYPWIAKEQKYSANKHGNEIVDVSLSYLFPKDGPALRTGEAKNPLQDYANLRDNATFIEGSGYNSNYESMRFDMEGDGGLFAKDANGYYTYDSAYLSAYYDQEKNHFLMSETLIGPAHDGVDKYVTSGNYARNFLPFNKINFDNKNQFYEFGSAQNNTKGEQNVYITKYATDGTVVEDLPDLWFGFDMVFDFFIPKDGKVNGEDMIFYFSGDDDIWVYIDDVLVLDIAGCHGPVAGKINFATGEVNDPNIGFSNHDTNGLLNSVRNITTLEELFRNALEDEFDETMFNETGGFVDYSKHTLKFFYLERGGNISYCKLKFNMPQLPAGSLSVGKELEIYDGETEVKTTDKRVPGFVTNAMSYEFRVLEADANGTATNKLYIPEGTEFALVDESDYTNVLGTGTVGEDGYFTLKAGQVALFKKVLENYGNKEYVVEERIPQALSGTYGEVKFTSDTKRTEAIVQTGDAEAQKYVSYFTHALTPDEAQKVTFTNMVNINATVPLAISKVLDGNIDAVKQESYQIKVWVGENSDSLLPLRIGTKYDVKKVNALETDPIEERTVKKTGIIELKADEIAEMKVLPGTSYKIEEVENNNYFYTPVYTNPVGNIDFDYPVAADVTITNIYAAPVIKAATNAADAVTEIGRTENYTISTKIPMVPDSVTNCDFWAKDILTGAQYVVAAEGDHVGKVPVKVIHIDKETQKSTTVTKYAEIITVDGKTGFKLDLSEYITADNAYFDDEISLKYDVVVKDVEVHNTVSLGNGEVDNIYGVASEDLYTGEIVLTKYAAKYAANAKYATPNDLTNNVKLSNAGFKVYKVEDEAKLWATFDSNNKLTGWVNSSDAATEVKTKSDGTLKVKGLDLGTYWFKEVTAPVGCTINESDVSATLEITANSETTGTTVETVATEIVKTSTHMVDAFEQGYVIIEKVLDTYNSTNTDTVFVFEVKVEQPSQGVYHELVTMKFTEAGAQSVKLGMFEGNSKVTVTELYSGAGYDLASGSVKTVTVDKFDPAVFTKVTFTNDHNNTPIGSNVIVNQYVLDKSNWTVTPVNKQSENAQDRKRLSWP